MHRHIARSGHTFLSRRAPGHLCSLVAATALLGGCSPEEKSPGGGGSTRGNLILTDDHNYQTTTTFTIPEVTTRVGSVDICWDGVTKDVLCHDIDPWSVDCVALTRFLGTTRTDLETTLASSNFSPFDVDAYFQFKTENTTTCTNLDRLNFFDPTHPIDVTAEYLPGDDYIYLLTVTRGEMPGVGAQTMLYLKPSADSQVSRVDMPPGCDVLDFEATLPTSTLSVPAAGPWVLDWAHVTTTGTGAELLLGRVDSALVGFYEDTTAEQFALAIEDWEINATHIWEIETLGDVQVDLAGAVEKNEGTAFPGFDVSTPGLWIVGLMCSTCQSPAPLVLAVLQPTL